VGRRKPGEGKGNAGRDERNGKDARPSAAQAAEQPAEVDVNVVCSVSYARHAPCSAWRWMHRKQLW
jgi:hypothetical protein